MSIKVMSVFGTRPEAIKMCPLVKELEKQEGIESIVCLTGQHKEMLQQVIDIFGIKINYNLGIMRPRQTLTTITTSVLEGMEAVLRQEKEIRTPWKKIWRRPQKTAMITGKFCVVLW